MILVFIKGIKGDSTILSEGDTPYFAVESFSFGVERELADSAKAGTADINIGVGELQEVSISKSMDSASPHLARRAISGSSCGTAEIKFLETITDDNQKQWNQVYLHFKLDTVFIKSWSISGDADDRPTEDVTLWYNRIAFQYFGTSDGKNFHFVGDCAWDHVGSKVWKDHGMGGVPDADGMRVSAD